MVKAVIPRQRTPSSAEPGYPDHDPRSRPDGIGWVTRAVFPGRGVRITVGADRGDGLRYAVVPSLDAARFLLPLPNRRVTVAAIGASLGTTDCRHVQSSIANPLRPAATSKSARRVRRQDAPEDYRS